MCMWLPAVRHDSSMCLYETWLIYMWHDSVTYDTTHSSVIWWLIHMRHDSSTNDMTSSCVPWLIHVFMCDTTHPCVTWLIHVWYDSLWCNTTHSRVTWPIHAWHDSCVCHWLIHTLHASPTVSTNKQRTRSDIDWWIIFFCLKREPIYLPACMHLASFSCDNFL